MKKTALITIVSLLFLSSFAAMGVSSGYTYVPPFTQTATLPSYSFVNQNFTMYVNETYGFSNYTITAYIGGENFSGASSLQSSLHKFSATNPDFEFNLTSPAIAQTIYIKVIAAASYKGANVTSSQTYTVAVSEPIVFHAQISNKGVSTVHNLTIDFYLDNSQFPTGQVTVASILPNQMLEINYTYPFETLTHGEHTIMVTASSSAVQVNGNSGQSTTHFYFGTPPNYSWIYYVAAAVIVFMVLFALSAGRRPAAGMRPPKWRRKK